MEQDELNKEALAQTRIFLVICAIVIAGMIYMTVEYFKL